jgi:hypothetical protein
MTVYSKLLGRALVTPGTPVDLFTAPAGVTTVIRDIEVNAYSVSGSGVAVLLVLGSIQFFVAPFSVNELTPHMECRIVLQPGDVVQALCTSIDCQFYVSGYELS